MLPAIVVHGPSADQIGRRHDAARLSTRDRDYHFCDRLDLVIFRTAHSITRMPSGPVVVHVTHYLQRSVRDWLRREHERKRVVNLRRIEVEELGVSARTAQANTHVAPVDPHRARITAGCRGCPQALGTLPALPRPAPVDAAISAAQTLRQSQPAATR